MSVSPLAPYNKELRGPVSYLKDTGPFFLGDPEDYQKRRHKPSVQEGHRSAACFCHLVSYLPGATETRQDLTVMDNEFITFGASRIMVVNIAFDRADALDRLIDRAINNAPRTGDDVSALPESMGSFTDDARDNSRQMLKRLSDFTDDNIGSVNTLMADLTNALPARAATLFQRAEVNFSILEIILPVMLIDLPHHPAWIAHRPTLEGRSWVTILPAPTTTLSPMVTPGSTIAPAPSQQFFPIRTGMLY